MGQIQKERESLVLPYSYKASAKETGAARGESATITTQVKVAVSAVGVGSAPKQTVTLDVGVEAPKGYLLNTLHLRTNAEIAAELKAIGAVGEKLGKQYLETLDAALYFQPHNYEEFRRGALQLCKTIDMNAITLNDLLRKNYSFEQISMIIYGMGILLKSRGADNCFECNHAIRDGLSVLNPAKTQNPPLNQPRVAVQKKPEGGFFRNLFRKKDK